MPLNGMCLNKLVWIAPRQSVKDRIIALKARYTFCDEFSAMLSNLKNLTEGQFEQFKFNGGPVQVIPYPTVAKVYEI